MVRAFANDVDFQRSVQPGDSLLAFIADGDEIEPHAQVLFATMTVRDQTFKYYRFQTPDDNLVDYYDENGRSVRKFLIRKPIVDGEMTSGFGMRFHPILHYAKMHTGVDWAAPIGTPILAAGNGVVIQAELTSGYGRRVEIQHANGYVTTYNHMSGFARGIVPGAHVTQGQVIGYLGQSGLATGPHLHYEVIINGNFVDPMAIKLARTREFDGRMLAAFKRERDRIDQLMRRRRAPARALRRRSRPRRSTEGGAQPPGAVAAESQRGAHFGGAEAGRAQVRQRRRGRAFRHFFARRVEHETMVAIARRLEPEQRLQQAMHRRRGQEIAAAHDVADALQRVVDDDREVVGRRPAFAAQHDVAPGFRRRFDAPLLKALAEFAPESPCRRQGAAREPCRAASPQARPRERARSPAAQRAAACSGAPSGSRWPGWRSAISPRVQKQG